MSTERIWELMARKLAEEASEDELGELEQLLRIQPGLHFPIQAISDLWQHQPPPNQEEEEATAFSYQQHIARMQEMGIPIGQAPEELPLLEGFRRPSRRRIFWWAAATIGLLTGVWFFYAIQPSSSAAQTPLTEKSPPNEITTRQGSKTKVQLPDGTHVWLNAGSKLTYDREFGGQIREVTLIGEGYFDVVRNEKKPFIIHTAKMDVKVLGTRFNVKSYPNDNTTEAALIHGSIEVSLKDRPSERIVLKPNEKIVVANRDTGTAIEPSAPRRGQEPEPLVTISHLTYQEKDSAIVETSWLENKLAFVDESFKDLALKMERWYGVTIQFNDEKTAALRFTGAFENETVEDAMRALNITAAFNYKFQGRHIIVSK